MSCTKEDGIELFLKGDFKLAKLLFSLADEDDSSFFLTNLCDLALLNSKKAQEIIGIYILKQDDEKVLNELIEVVENRLNSYYLKKRVSGSINYSEVSNLFQTRKFEDIFEPLMLNSSLTISTQEEMFDFINKLIQNSYITIAYNLIEKVSKIYLDSQEINKLIIKIKQYESKL